MSLYADLVAAGVPIDNHESDLYARVTPVSQVLIERYEYRVNVTVFKNQKDSALWYDIPFAYDPFWERRAQHTT